MEELTQRNYLKIRNNYIIPAVRHSEIKLNEYDYFKLKKSIFDNFIDVANPNNNDYKLKVPKKIIDKGRFSEIEQFYVRAKYQQDDFLSLNNNGTASWMITTQYYRLFFLCTCMQRILNMGYFWVTQEESNYFSNVLSIRLGSLINLGKGNYRYYITSYNQDDEYYEVLITKQGSNMHQLTWLELKQSFNKFIEDSIGSERRFIENLKKSYNSIENYSPSTIRNEVNYSSETSIQELKNHINCSPIKLKNILSLVENFNLSTRINSGSKLTIIISEYLDLLITKILKDVYQRNKKSCKLVKKFEKLKNIKLIS